MMAESIVEALFKYSEIQPDKFCIVDDENSYTYLQMKELILTVAENLSKKIQLGDCVVVEAEQTGLYLACELAIQLCGGVFVPLEYHTPLSKLTEIADLTNAPLIISGKTDCTHEKVIGFADLTVENGLYRFEDYPKADTVCEILFSTGTTGKEKGIVLTHKNDIAVAENIAYAVNLKPDNVEMIPSPLNHSHGLRSFYADILMGSTVIVLKSMMDMNRFYTCMDKYGVTSMDLVPTALAVLLRFSKGKIGEYRDRLRYIEFGSSKLEDATKQRIKELLPGIPLYNFYGSTESGRTTVYNFNTDKEKEACIGKPTKNAKVITVNDNRDEIIATHDAPGLLAFSGDMNMVEYYNDPTETAGAKRGQVIFSNDLAYIDEDGDIILLGRKGDVINIGGRKVSPEEIEDAVKEHPDVTDAGCISIPDRILGAVPVLFVTYKKSKQFSEDELTDFLRTKLELFKVPRHIYETESIPRTFNGKIIRRELKEYYASLTQRNKE